jgi:hypothetical protein
VRRCYLARTATSAGLAATQPPGSTGTVVVAIGGVSPENPSPATTAPTAATRKLLTRSLHVALRVFNMCFTYSLCLTPSSVVSMTVSLYWMECMSGLSHGLLAVMGRSFDLLHNQEEFGEPGDWLDEPEAHIGLECKRSVRPGIRDTSSWLTNCRSSWLFLTAGYLLGNSRFRKQPTSAKTDVTLRFAAAAAEWAQSQPWAFSVTRRIAVSGPRSAAMGW